MSVLVTLSWRPLTLLCAGGGFALEFKTSYQRRKRVEGEKRKVRRWDEGVCKGTEGEREGGESEKVCTRERTEGGNVGRGEGS